MAYKPDSQVEQQFGNDHHVATAESFTPRASQSSRLWPLLPWAMLLCFALWWLLRPVRLTQIMQSRTMLMIFGLQIILALGVASLPTQSSSRLVRGLRWVAATETRALVLLGIIYTILRLTLGNMPWSQDMTGLFHASEFLATNGLGHFFRNYHALAWLGHQHPPLAALYFGGAMAIFGVSGVTFYGAAYAITLAVLALTYRVGCVLYNRWVGLLGALFVMFTRSFLEHNVNMSNDMVLLVWVLLLVLGVLLLRRHGQRRYQLLTGMALGLGLLTKYTMLFLVPWLVLVLLVGVTRRETREHDPKNQWWQRLAIRRAGIREIVVIGVVALALTTPWLLFAVQSGGIDSHVGTVAQYAGVEQEVDGSTRITLTNSWHNRQRLAALTDRWPARLGFHYLPLLALGLVAMARRPRWSDWVVFVWMGVVILPVFALLPLWRYLTPAYPAIAILLARGLVFAPVTIQGRMVVLAGVCTVFILYFNLYSG